MPIQVNPLILQDLFYQMLDDLEHAQESLYNDEVSRLMNLECKKKRIKYERKFRELIE